MDNQPKSLISVMAEKYSMEPKAFADAVRKTAMPSNATTEEFAAFMMVAKEYNLNPLLKEIHAFPKRGGGIQPVVSIDGWVSLINQHPDNNGFEFETLLDNDGALAAVTCRMYRKSRAHPVEVTEYLSECYRATDAWKMPNRMLRHKALIQAARYCFGFSGIMEEDEAERIPMRDVTPAPERPKMAQFIKPLKPPEESPQDEKKLEATDANPEDEKAPRVKPGPPDGGWPRQTNPDNRYMKAFEQGIKHRQDGKPNVPPSSLDSAFHADFAAGWTDEDDSRKTGKLV